MVRPAGRTAVASSTHHRQASPGASVGGHRDGTCGHASSEPDLATTDRVELMAASPRSLTGPSTRVDSVGAVRDADGMDEPAHDPLAELAGITGQLGELRARRDALVVVARDAGASWAQVADALGVSAQAAHKRYRDVRLDLTGRAWKEPRLPL